MGLYAHGETCVFRSSWTRTGRLGLRADWEGVATRQTAGIPTERPTLFMECMHGRLLVFPVVLGPINDQLEFVAFKTGFGKRLRR